MNSFPRWSHLQVIALKTRDQHTRLKMGFRPCMIDTCHWESGPSCQTGLLTESGPRCQTGLLTVSGPSCETGLLTVSDPSCQTGLLTMSSPSCQTGLLTLQMKAQHSLKQWEPHSHWHSVTPGDPNPNCTTLRTSNVTGSGWHLVVCCSADQEGSNGRHDSCTIWHTACHTQLLQHILSTHSGPFTILYCLAATLSPPVLSLLPPSTASITRWHLGAYDISSVT